MTERDAMVHVDRVGEQEWCHSRGRGFGVGDKTFSQQSVGQTQSMAWLGQCRLIVAWDTSSEFLERMHMQAPRTVPTLSKNLALRRLCIFDIHEKSMNMRTSQQFFDVFVTTMYKHTAFYTVL